jgi:hypothetical protein
VQQRNDLNLTGQPYLLPRSDHDVWIYVDTSKDVGNPEHLKVFANEVAAPAWFAKCDPEGVAFKYEVLQ